jgi:hypothetical protein
MDITIKATLCEGVTYKTLYYSIKFKLGKSLLYKQCNNLFLISMWDSDYTTYEDAFRKKSIRILRELSESEIEEMIINKVKDFLKQKKSSDYNKNEYQALLNKYGKLKFKVKI